MAFPDIVWSELFEDGDGDAAFDRDRRFEPPWFGFTPRVLAADLTRPYRPRLALWCDGRVVEERTLGVDRRRCAGAVRPLLALAERFADVCRERNLFGAYFAVFDFAGDPARAAVTAALTREADWCGMFVAEPAPFARRRGVAPAAALAAAVAAALNDGTLTPPPPVARRGAFPAAEAQTSP